MRKEIAALQREVGGVEDLSEVTARLEAQRTALAAARERYTADHPDVKRLEKSIASLKQEAAEAATIAPRKGPAGAEPDNPAYIQLQAQVTAAETELRTLREKREELKGRVAEYETRLTRTPQVEREYRALARDYENAVAKYQEIKAKQMEAELAEVLESERKGERYSLIEPPLLPEKPARPNRPAILFLGLVLSFAGGLGSVALAEAMDDTLRDRRSVEGILNAPPLAVIPYIETPYERRLKVWRRAGATLTIVVAIVFTAALVHWFVKPLDVAWFVALRRLGV